MRDVACHDLAATAAPLAPHSQGHQPRAAARSPAIRAAPNLLPAADPPSRDIVGAWPATQQAPAATDHVCATSPTLPVASAMSLFATFAAIRRPLRSTPSPSRAR